MNKLTRFVCGLAVVLLACGPAMAQDGEAKAKPEKPKGAEKARKAKPSGLRGEYGIMAGVLEFDDAQKAKLLEAVEANKAAERQWMESGDGKKMQELSKAYAEARKGEDKEKAKPLAEQLRALKESRAKLQEAGKARIMAVLSDQQKTIWAAFNLQRRAMMRYKRLKLTEDQLKQVKEICAEAVKNRKAGDDRKALNAADKKLMSDIEQKVLTNAQREELKKPPEKPKKDKKGEMPAKGDEKPEGGN